MRICIVDDSAAQRIVLAALLKSHGYRDLLIAASVTEAFSLLDLDQSQPESVPVDLILMDINMPEIDGIEACRQIKAADHLQDIPIIMVTASTEAEDLERAFAAGAIDYITKPLNKVELLVRVRSALKLKHEMDERKANERELLELTEYLEAANQILWREQEKSDRLLRTIYAIGTSVSANITLTETLQHIITSINSIISYDAAEICLYDAMLNQMIVHVTATPELINTDSGLAYDLSQGYLGLLMSKRTGLVLSSLEVFPDQHPNPERWQRLHPQTYLGVPLLASDEIIGTIELISQQANSFNQDNLRFLESIAIQAAMAVRNTQQLQLRDQRLKDQITELRIEIDEAKLSKQVAEIVSSEFFQTITEKAQRLRNRSKPH